MTAWPGFDAPELRERLALGEEAFRAYVLRFAGHLGRRELTEALYRRALRYPWARPEHSYVLLGTEVQPVGPAALETFTRDRFPVLAFGSNGSPKALSAKLSHLPAGEHDTLVLAGWLHGFDVGASAAPSAYGAMPATLFPSDGAAARCAVLWLTEAQVTHLTWSELSYRFGRLDGIRFEADEPGVETHTVFAYVSRFGAFAPEGEPVALEAIPARARRAPALTQEELLAAAARIVLGPDATARTLMEAVFDDMAALAPRAIAALRAHAQPFASGHWTPYA